MSKLKEYRQKWIDFLREEGRQKARNVLEDVQNPEARCCLGHACKVFENSVERTLVLGDNDTPVAVKYDKTQHVLPSKLQRKLNIDAYGKLRKPIKIENGRYVDLVSINDSTNLSPAQIADVIEEQFKQRNFKGAPRS